MRQDLWRFSTDGLTGEREASLPTLFAVGNGMLGMRGTLPELCPGLRDDGLLVAGFYDRLPRPEIDPKAFNPFLVSWSHMEKVPGYKREACLIKCPLPLDGLWEVDGAFVDVQRAKLLRLHRSLAMRTGLFEADAEFELPGGKRVRLLCRRFASMARSGLLVEERTLTPLNFSGTVSLHSWINTEQANFNISGIYQDTTPDSEGLFLRLYDTYQHRALSQNSLLLTVRGRMDGEKGAFAVRTEADGARAERGIRADGLPHLRSVFAAKEGQPCRAERVAAVAVSVFSIEPADEAEALLKDAPDFETLHLESAGCWKKLWHGSDVQVEGDDEAQLSLRHGIYQLLIAAHRESGRVSVAAKGLSGEGYRGMVFWDTDIHMMLFYLLTQPEIARSLACFRAGTLQGAREKASSLGCLGACYPWETGISGREECEDFLKLATHQLHITADVVYAMNAYVEMSGDTDFYLHKAIPVYVETARFWLSRGKEESGLLTIPQASGPDELHLECDNNAYVNHLAAMNLRLASQGIRLLEREHPALFEALLADTGIEPLEIERIHHFQDKVKDMRGPLGLLEQCEGFFRLEDRVVYEDDAHTAPAQTQTVKQADVIMLLYLLPGLFTAGALRANWDYYEPRTTHTSSLSYGVHGIVAARLGLLKKARDYISRSLRIDLSAEGDQAQDGAHLAANGMSYCAVTQGFGGARMEGDTLHISPVLPKEWQRLAFRWKRRGAAIRVEITHDEIRVANEAPAGEALEACLWKQFLTVPPGGEVRVQRS